VRSPRQRLWVTILYSSPSLADMVSLSSLLIALSVASSTIAYRSYAVNREAKISLFEASSVSKAPSSDLTNLDCGSQLPSTEITLPVDYCLWGDDFLVNNFKITTYPTCGNGARAVALFYSTTSCTGNPTFRSDQANVDLSDRCLFGSSPDQWSMIFRCENFDSQSVSRRSFKQAIPPLSISDNKFVSSKPTATHGVVTPYFAYDCSINRPKEPTFLPADTCLTLEVGHSVFISQTVICANGNVAFLQTYDEPRCFSPSSGPETDAFSDSYFKSIDKKCHTTNARSIAFICNESEYMTKFEDVPRQEMKDVEPLVILAPPPPVQKPISDSEPSSSKSQANIGDSITSSTGSSNTPLKPQGATMQAYNLKKCKSDRAIAPLIRPVDTCIWTFMWESIQVKSPAVCPNGTQALFATYSRPGCKPSEMQSLGELPAVYSSGCAGIENIDSIAFWCEGLSPSEIGNKGSLGGLVKMLLIMLLIVFLMIALSILSCCLRGAAMMKQGRLVWDQIMELFGKREGEIQL